MYPLEVLLRTTQTSTPKHSPQFNPSITQVSISTASTSSIKEEILENSALFGNLPIDKFSLSRRVAMGILINWIILLGVIILSTTISITFKTIQSMIFTVFACDLIVTVDAIAVLWNSRVTGLLLNETINISTIATRIANIAVVVILLGFEPTLIDPTKISMVAPDSTRAIKCLIIIGIIGLVIVLKQREPIPLSSLLISVPVQNFYCNTHGK